MPGGFTLVSHKKTRAKTSGVTRAALRLLLNPPKLHPMFKIIGGDGREYGPVTAEQIGTWIAQNRANGQTMVKAEGAADWQPLAQFSEFAAALEARVNASTSFPPPIPTAATAEPATPASDPAAAAHACAGRSYRLSVMDSLSQGWNTVTSQFWLTVGGTTVVLLINMIAGLIPGVSLLVSLLLTQVFYAGIYWLMLRVSRGEEAELSDVFGGFSRAFGQLVLLTLVTVLITVFLLAVAAAPLLMALFKIGGLELFKGGPEAFANVDFSQIIGPILLFPVLAAPLIYLSIAWIFAPILVVDRRLGFWEAMQLSRKVTTKRWFRLFFLHLAFIPLFIAGLLCFLVGILVAMALYYAAFTAAYEAAFAPEANSNGNDPTPTQ